MYIGGERERDIAKCMHAQACVRATSKKSSTIITIIITTTATW